MYSHDDAHLRYQRKIKYISNFYMKVAIFLGNIRSGELESFIRAFTLNRKLFSFEIKGYRGKCLE